jgi:hypothetical protein
MWWVFVVLLGCGDNNGVPDDGGSNDGASGPGDAAKPGLVTLTAKYNGAVYPHLPVYFQNADNSLVSATETDDQGVASAVMVEGGFATAVGWPPDATSPQLATFAGVKPGDLLTLDAHGARPQTFMLSAPIDPDPMVAKYVLLTTCGVGPALSVSPVAVSASVSLDLCIDDTVDLLLESLDAHGNTLRGLFQSVTLVPGGTVTLTGLYQALQTVQVSYRNSTYDGGHRIDFVFATPRGQLFRRSAQVNGSTASASMPQFSIPGAAVFASITPVTALPPGFPITVTFRAPFASSYAFDLALPFDWFDGPVVLFDPNFHGLFWRMGGQEVLADFVEVRVDAVRDGLPAPLWSWAFAAPSSKMYFPVLPAPVDVYNFPVGGRASVEDFWGVTSPGDTTRPGRMR